MTSNEPDESAYERAVHDDAFRAALEARLGSDENVLDLLWWREHPDLPTPAGTPPASQARHELKRRVYSRPTEVEEHDAAAVELAAINDRTQAMNARLEEAIPLARADVESNAGRFAPSEVESHQQPSRSRAGWVIGTGIGAFVAGIAVATFVPSIANGAPQIPPAAIPTPVAVRALDVFDSGELAGLPADALPQTLDAESAVLMAEIVRSKIYAVRSTSHQACLVALEPTGEAASTCVSDENFPEFGLRLAWSELVERPEGITETADLYATWMPDGTLDVGGTSRQ